MMTAVKKDKRTELKEVYESVEPGTLLALQGVSAQTTPMAFLRGLIRVGIKDLSVVQFVGGIGADWLARSGSMSHFIGCAVTFERYGLAPHFRRGVELGEIEFEEYTEHILASRLEAGARNLPYMITRCGRGTDLVEVHPETLIEVEDPFKTDGERVLACRALRADMAVIHAHRADRWGNVQFLPAAIWPDLQVLPRAADRVVATVEDIVDTSVIQERPEATCLTHFEVDAVVELPGGAHPTAMPPHYGLDESFMTKYLAATRDDEQIKQFFETYVLNPDSHEEYRSLPGIDISSLPGGDSHEPA